MANFKDVVEGETPVLVDFYATWCGPCQMMPPILDEVKSHFKDKVRILKIDVDKNPKVAAAFQVRGVPSLFIFKNGKPVWQESGVIPARNLIQILNQHLN